jgi:hypothetical protein
VWGELVVQHPAEQAPEVSKAPLDLKLVTKTFDCQTADPILSYMKSLRHFLDQNSVSKESSMETMNAMTWLKFCVITSSTL